MDEVPREGRPAMLTQALAAEVDACIAQFAGERDEHGRRRRLGHVLGMSTRLDLFHRRSEWPPGSLVIQLQPVIFAQRHSKLNWRRKFIYLCSSW